MTETVEVQEPKERAILVGAHTKDISSLEAQEHLEELAQLADTAEAVVVGEVRQRLDSPHPKLYVGEGKAHELKEVVAGQKANLVIFDEELTPAQGKNLEALLGVRVIDRAEVILGIFARRARTAEAQLQVELAQLQYLLPRLKRMWTHLSRSRGGVNMRGPGETQLETDRRLVGKRIRDLRGKLAVVARRRATQRKGRSEEFRVSLVGYTNAGKSSVLKALSGAEVHVEDRLFATLDPTTRIVELPPVGRALVTDTVGFIRKLPHHLVASFRATLEEALDADVLLHVIDASFETWPEHKDVVEGVLADLDVQDRPTLLVFNKMDRLLHEEEQRLRQRAAQLFVQPMVFVSALEKDGLQELRAWLEAEVQARRPSVALRIDSADGEALATVYREGEVLSRADDGSFVDLVARVPTPTLGRLRRRETVEVREA